MIFGMGNHYRQNVSSMFGQRAQEEEMRVAQNKQAEQSKKQSMVGGAASGAAIGASFGPWGAAIGAGVGLLGGALF